MKLHKRDPAVYVFAGLLLVSVLISITVASIRSNIKREYIALRHPILNDKGYRGKPKYIERREFGGLLSKTIEIDFGTGVQYMSRTLAAESILGLPEGYEKQQGGYKIYSYLYPDKPDVKEVIGHESLGLLAFARCANVTFRYKDDKLRGRFFSASPFNFAAGTWPFLRIGDKPMTECVSQDLLGIFGEPTEAKGNTLVWYYKPQPLKPDNPIQALYAHAVFNRPNDKLSELYISLD